MTRAALSELIEKLEKAEGPNLALEWEIHLTVRGIEGAGMYGAHPNYTASIDAAMKLVPDKVAIREMGHVKPDKRDFYVVLGPPTFEQGCHADPAIALCIAACKSQFNANAS
jgi:hypothetical protein